MTIGKTGGLTSKPQTQGDYDRCGGMQWKGMRKAKGKWLPINTFL